MPLLTIDDPRRRWGDEAAGRETDVGGGLAFFLQHYPHQLSGGMQQRVNLARVLVNRPRIILMDEPFCSLDAQTRLQMQQMLLQLWHELHMTIVFVTHDVDEAVFLSDRVVVLSRRPGTVKAEVPVALPRPRTMDLLTSQAFMKVKREALELLLDAGRGARPLSSRRPGGLDVGGTSIMVDKHYTLLDRSRNHGSTSIEVSARCVARAALLPTWAQATPRSGAGRGRLVFIDRHGCGALFGPHQPGVGVVVLVRPR